MSKDVYVVKMVVYSVKKNKLKTVLPAVKEFVKTVNKKEKGTLMYVAYQKKDRPHEFVHIMVFKDKKAEKTHSKSQHAKKFVEVLYPNTMGEPVFIDLKKLL